MRLTIQHLAQPMEAGDVSQRYAIRSASRRVGTRNLNNCLGVVLHNRVGHVGVVGHVEAQDANIYDRIANAAIATMLEDLNNNGGSGGSLSLVLLGNGLSRLEGGVRIGGVNVDLNPFGVRLCPRDFVDHRGVGGCILDPVAEILYLDPACARILPIQTWQWGVSRYSIQ